MWIYLDSDRTPHMQSSEIRQNCEYECMLLTKINPDACKCLGSQMLELVRPERTFVRLTIDRHIEVDFSLNRHFCTRALAVNVNISQKEFAHNTRVRYHHFCFSAFSTSSVYNFLYVHKILTSTLGTPKKPLERSFLHVCAIHDTYHHVSVNLLRITIHPFNSNMNTNSDNKLGKYKGSQFLPPCHHNQI